MASTLSELFSSTKLGTPNHFLPSHPPVIVVAVSTRALFQQEESTQIFRSQGVEAFNRYQIENEEKILGKGVAFDLVRKLALLQDPITLAPLVEVVILSNCAPSAGVRVNKSVTHYGLGITKAAFTGGEPKWPYLAAFHVDLFLEVDEKEVEAAIAAGHAAAKLLPKFQGEENCCSNSSEQIRIAFDFDRVIAGGKSDEIWQKNQEEYFIHEEINAKEVIDIGPFKPLLEKLCYLKSIVPTKIALGIFTARSAPADLRVLYSLRQWNLNVDATFFIGHLSKAPFLQRWKPDIFFDDSQQHVSEALQHAVLAARVLPMPVTEHNTV